MSFPTIKYCPGTLSEGYETYSKTALKHVFDGKKVSHILPYDSPASNEQTDELFEENRKRMSISGVQEKFSVLLEKNKLRLVKEGEQGQYILKPIPSVGKNPNEMPANEHLTMQIAKQVFGIETAENALIFFKNGTPAYITKRFDTSFDGSKKAQEDFASLTGRTPQTHGENYKYLGNYFDLFKVMKKYVPAYSVEAPKLFRINIPDPNLEKVIRETIAKPVGDIYESDLRGLTALNASSQAIANLDGLEYCTNLTHLYLGGNQIIAISPLSDLTSLTHLYLGGNQIIDISSLSDLTSLTELNLCNNNVFFDDISPLSDLTNLTHLYLNNNYISDISPLSSLTNLTELDLQFNSISDISPLSGLTSLRYLSLGGNEIIDIKPLVSNPGLSLGDSIMLWNNPLNTISIHTYIPKLESRGVWVLYF